jgi:hypothetical protein
MRFVVGLSALYLCCVAVFAQSDRGTITGTVSDPAGAVVANATIEAKNTATGTSFEAATTSSPWQKSLRRSFHPEHSAIELSYGDGHP